MISTKFRNERGIALMLCLFALLLLTTIAAGLMFMANTETSVNYNYRSAQQAYYASKAGLEEARERLRFGSTYSVTPPSGVPSSSNATGIIYILNTPSTSDDAVAPGTDTNAYYDDELCNEPFFTSAGANSVFNGYSPTIGVPCDTSHLPPSGSFTTFTSIDPGYNTQAALGYKWVRVTTKQNCTASYGVDGSIPCNSTNVNRSRQVCADPNDLVNSVPREILIPSGAATCESASPALRTVYVITSLAASRRIGTGIGGSGARRMTQYEIASVTLPPLPAALTLDGPTPKVNISFPDSNANMFDGNDHGTPGCTPGPAVPAIATIDATSNSNVISILPKPDNYIGAGTTTPSVQNLTLASQYSTVGALQQLVSNISAGADQTFGNNPSGVDLGSDANPKVTVVNGDFNMGNSHGAGLLLVTGAFTTSGNPDFNGVILVIGKGIANLSGGGNGAFNGGMFVANLYDGAGAPLPANSIPGSPIFTWNGGGNFNFNYSSCWINNLAARLPYKVIASREEMY
jgi:hypothetical protein